MILLLPPLALQEGERGATGGKNSSSTFSPVRPPAGRSLWPTLLLPPRAMGGEKRTLRRRRQKEEEEEEEARATAVAVVSAVLSNKGGRGG